MYKAYDIFPRSQKQSMEAYFNFKIPHPFLHFHSLQSVFADLLCMCMCVCVCTRVWVLINLFSDVKLFAGIVMLHLTLLVT